MWLPRRSSTWIMLVLLTHTVGCGTTRTTDTPRCATEMLLVSQAVDNAVAQIDFSPLAGKTVYLDATALNLPGNEVIDRGYLISLVRQQLLAAGALLYDEKHRADYVVELRSGGLGTDRHSMLVGTPALQLPSVVPGLPTNIPEIALIKRNDQRGIAKVAVFAYNRVTGRAVWQSGTVEAISLAKDIWILGAGPFSGGSIRKRPELAGEPLPPILPDIPSHLLGGHLPAAEGTHPRPSFPPHPLGEQYFPNHDDPPPPRPIPAGLLGITGAAAVVTRPVMH